MSHGTHHQTSSFNTTKFTIYLLSTVAFFALLLYSIGVTQFTNYATNPKTGTQVATAGSAAPSHEEAHGGH